MSKTINSKLLVRRDSSSNWTTNNPVLSQGEIGYDNTEGKIKIGNGSSTWSNLPFFALEKENDVQYFEIEALATHANEITLSASLTQIAEAIQEKKQLILKISIEDPAAVEGSGSIIYGYYKLGYNYFPGTLCSLVAVMEQGIIVIEPSDWEEGESPVRSELTMIPFDFDIPQADDDTLGGIRTNSNEGIYTDIETGVLTVEGRLGQFNNQGLYYPRDINPTLIGGNSLLITDENNVTAGSKSLAVTTGFGVDLTGSHAANSTTYYVKNIYQNRIVCMLAKDGTLLNTADGSIGNVVSVQINGQDYIPGSSANSDSQPIAITVDQTINPSAAITKIRIVPPLKGFSNLFIGAAGGNSTSAGYSAVIGQMVFNASNASSVFGNSQYNTGNSSLLAGRQHINTQMNAFLAGRGHDSSNGSDGVSAVGAYSNITSNTAFAVGNGTSHTSRKNAFQVTKTGKVILSIAPVDNMDAVNKGYVDTAIASIEAPQAESDANVILMLNQLGLTTNRSLQTGYVGTTKTGTAVASSYTGGGS